MIWSPSSKCPKSVNAIQQAIKEITTRFDLKDSHSDIELNEKDKKINLASADEFKLKAVDSKSWGKSWSNVRCR